MEMKLDTKLPVLIRIAEKHGACSDEIDRLKLLGDITLADMIDHTNAPYWAVWYARDVIKGRWLEAEDIIKTDPFRAYLYARDIIEGRWLEIEDTIAESEWAYWYTREVIEGEWD